MFIVLESLSINFFPISKENTSPYSLSGYFKDKKAQSYEYTYRIGNRDYTFELSSYPSLGGLSVFTKDITERKRTEEEREKLISDLRGALAKIKTLRGIIPICAKCKKIRDDKGYWKQVEENIRDHTDAEFSHGLCPECVAEMEKEIDEME